MKQHYLKTVLIGAALTFAALHIPLNVSAEQDDGTPKKNGVPPGLQKKGGLPPGQAKKRAREEAKETTNAVTAKTAVPQPTTPVVPPTPAPTVNKPIIPEAPKTTPVLTKTPEAVKPPAKVSQEVQHRREKLEGHVTELDSLAKQKPEVQDRMVVRLNRQFDVPLASIAAQQKANPRVGVGGLLVAHHIARASKQPPETILADHKAGKTWGEIANDRKVSLVELNEKMHEAREVARSAERQAAKK